MNEKELRTWCILVRFTKTYSILIKGSEWCQSWRTPFEQILRTRSNSERKVESCLFDELDTFGLIMWVRSVLNSEKEALNPAHYWYALRQTFDGIICSWDFWPNSKKVITVEDWLSDGWIWFCGNEVVWPITAIQAQVKRTLWYSGWSHRALVSRWITSWIVGLIQKDRNAVRKLAGSIQNSLNLNFIDVP